MQAAPGFFWLHIKKSAGQSTRQILAPDYVEVDRSRQPMTFIQAAPYQYNDILNNHRIPLGDMQFRRALFAKTYLFPESWDSLSSFAFSRDPVRRCVSAFFNLSRDMARARLGPVSYSISSLRRRVFPRHRDFDRFLTMIEQARASGSNYHPYGLSFSTHTAAMWDDVVDDAGTVLLRHIFRLEDLLPAIAKVFEESGISRSVTPLARPVNVNKKTGSFEPTKAQIARIQTLYAKDFEIHEGMCHRF